MVPKDQQVFVSCQSTASGKQVRSECSVGCIACRICVKACPVEAIGFDHQLAWIDPEICTQCLICVEKCPTGAIEGPVEPAEETAAGT